MLIAVPLAVVGVWFISAAFSGYFWQALTMDRRVGFGVSGLLMLIPHNVAAWAWWTDVIGVLMAVVLLWDQRRAARAVVR
jgi:TRAP-type uncharacterized transport system fused permease subunit